jgi:hypothetical protein
MRFVLPRNRIDKQLAILKNEIKGEQETVAQKVLVLKDSLKYLDAKGEMHRAKESKRCQALYDFVLLRLKARLSYLYEYNFNLALIRSDSLIPLEGGDKLYRLTPQERLQVNEPVIRQYTKDLKKGWIELTKNHPQTPWAYFAEREQSVMLGLSWQPGKK